ncbi:hypothetical protein PB01_14380 [Psychrobacillus glaciei]|uniref:Uncharacterized protein n=1 Tax=Psychrobacillus glaciei TaxID=2283160 RepID=A0A5J6STL0_9BACI|nr:hypothetical protein PB01_14380 [Psychrobacillus glaciei]
MKKHDDKIIYCYCCRKRTLFVRRDLHNNSGVESHCSECSYVWFEWQNRAVEREKEKWIEYNGEVANKTNGGQIFIH